MQPQDAAVASPDSSRHRALPVLYDALRNVLVPRKSMVGSVSGLGLGARAHQVSRIPGKSFTFYFCFGGCQGSRYAIN
jgi:hypothetical protein